MEPDKKHLNEFVSFYEALTPAARSAVIWALRYAVNEQAKGRDVTFDELKAIAYESLQGHTQAAGAPQEPQAKGE